MRLIISVFFSIVSICSSAQTPDREDWDIWQSNYQDESTIRYVYANKVLVRNDSSTNGLVLDTLLNGEKIRLLRKTKSFSTINNVYAPWMQIEYANGKKGYVWLGLISFQQLIKEDTVFMYGINRISVNASNADYDERQIHIGLKAVYQLKLLDKKEWPIAADESSSFAQSKLLGNMGLQNIHEIARINIGGEACGIPSNYFYHGWNGEKFFDLPRKYTVGDADVFSHVETLLFPAEKGGKPGYIVKVVEEEEMIEEEKNNKPAKYKRKNSRELYTWNGVEAVKVK